MSADTLSAAQLCTPVTQNSAGLAEQLLTCATCELGLDTHLLDVVPGKLNDHLCLQHAYLVSGERQTPLLFNYSYPCQCYLQADGATQACICLDVIVLHRVIQSPAKVSEGVFS